MRGAREGGGRGRRRKERGEREGGCLGIDAYGAVGAASRAEHRLFHGIGGSLEKFFNSKLYRSLKFSIEEQLPRRIVERFRVGLVFTAHELVYHSTHGSRVIKKKRKKALSAVGIQPRAG